MIGCIAVVHAVGGGFIGLQCAKGRGLILPGGKWEISDPSWHHTASRELSEETGLQVSHEHLRYLWHGPDGHGYTTFAFHAGGIYQCPTTPTEEGVPQVVYPCDLFKSHFAAYYRVLFEVCSYQLREPWPV